MEIGFLKGQWLLTHLFPSRLRFVLFNQVFQILGKIITAACLRHYEVFDLYTLFILQICFTVKKCFVSDLKGIRQQRISQKTGPEVF